MADSRRIAKTRSVPIATDQLASISVSIGGARIEISGSHGFVSAQLSNLAAVQSLWLVVEKSRVAQQRLETTIAEAEKAQDEAAENVRQARETLRRYMEEQEELAKAATRLG